MIPSHPWKLLALLLLSSCVSTPLWSVDHASSDVTTVKVERVYQNGTIELTIIPPDAEGDGGLTSKPLPMSVR